MDMSLDLIVEEILENCQERELDVDKDYIEFLAGLVSPDPTEITKRNAEVINRTVKKILFDQARPSSVTLRLQFGFFQHYLERDNLIRSYRTQLATKTLPLISEICETRAIDGPHDIDVLYQKMMVVVILLSSLGNPMNPIVLREVGLAMHSVLQPSELPSYVSLPRYEKEKQLMELVFIVTGIRLFNHDSQKPGEEIDDLPKILQEGVECTKNLIIETLESLMEKIYKITAAVDASLHNSYFTELIDNPETSYVLYYIEMLVTARQQEIYIRKLVADLETSENEIRSLINQFNARLAGIYDTVKFRTAVPTRQIYPQFRELAELWLRMQDEVVALCNTNEVLHLLIEIFPHDLDASWQKYLDKILQDVQVLTDAERLEKTMGKTIIKCGRCTVGYLSNDLDLAKLNLRFLGFCAWSFVAGKGALIPANPNLGIVTWKSKCYAFSSIDVARLFGDQPEKFETAALEFIREHPSYIHLFQVLHEIKSMNSIESIAIECLPLKTLRDQIVQTESHPIQSYIDHNYSHSLWEYRRRALTYASLVNCRTKGVQTNNSHFRNVMWVQTYPLKDKSIQTSKENSTNPLKSKNYVFGMKGGVDDIIMIDCAFTNNKKNKTILINNSKKVKKNRNNFVGIK